MKGSARLVVAALLASVLAGCGDDTGGSGSGSGSGGSGPSGAGGGDIEHFDWDDDGDMDEADLFKDDCYARCRSRLRGCFDADIETADHCGQLCSQAVSEEQVVCLESQSCEDAAADYEALDSRCF
jgi:hypothetical protein